MIQKNLKKHGVLHFDSSDYDLKVEQAIKKASIERSKAFRKFFHWLTLSN